VNDDPFATFDPTPYQTAPQLPLQTLVVLGKTLASRVPGDVPAYVEEGKSAMLAVVAEAEAAMVIRLRESNEARLTADLNFDNAIDGLWALLRERLKGWSRYERPGLDVLLHDKALKVDFEEVRIKAARAGVLATQLFGEGTLEMLSKPWPEQSQLMANVLRLIETDKLDEGLLELAGDELLPIIAHCQTLYVAMVDRRSSQTSSSQADLRGLRAKLQRAIVRHNGLMMTLMNPAKPGTRGMVEQALEPMITLRPQSNGSGGVEEPVDADLPAGSDPDEQK
jgi:hypothetical protein